MVEAIPSLNVIAGSQPSDLTFVTSRTLRGVPSGFDESQAISPLKPASSATNSANSLIVRSSPLPILRWTSESYFLPAKTTADARSSTCKNSRIGEPVPHKVSFVRADSVASTNRRMNAGKTCEP